MQLDKTEIVIRQRSTIELLDLTLIVVRKYWWQLAASSAVFGLPLLALNVWLTSWMLGDQGFFAMAESENPSEAVQNRYLMHTIALWYLQFPLASFPATVMLGHLIFFEQLTLGRLMAMLRPNLFRAIMVLGFMRMGLLGIPIVFSLDRDGIMDVGVEIFFLIILCCGWSTLRRAAAPYAPEILGLESCRLRARTKNELSYWRRSRSLHGALIGDSIGRLTTCAVVVTCLVLMTYSLMFVGDFVGLRRGRVDFFNAALSNRVLIQIVLPLAMWLAGIFATVFRFLTYLDSRIRLEGWEVELQLKAERARVQQTMVATAPVTKNPELESSSQPGTQMAEVRP